MKPTSTLGRIRLAALAAILAMNAAQATMVGYWNFNEGTGTTVNDLSTRNNDGGTLITSTGGLPTWVAGHTGNASDKALQFHGYSDRVNVPVATSLGLTNAFTIAFWAKAEYLGAYVYPLMFTNDTTGANRQWFVQSDNSGGDQMYVWSNANTAWNKGLGFKVGGGGDAYAWHHYAFKYSGGSLTAYVDGTLKGTYPISGSPNFPSFTNLNIGSRGAVFSSWEGPMDDVVIFDTAESDIASIMNGTHPEMVAATSTPYGDWATYRGLTGAAGSSTDPAAGADPDKDARTNVEEFGLDGIPTNGANDGKVVSKTVTLPSDGKKVLTLTLPVRRGATFSGATEQVSPVIDGIVYTIQGSDTLAAGSWTQVVSEITDAGDLTLIQAGLPALSDLNGDSITDWTYRTFKLNASEGLASKGFLRARIAK